MAIDDKKRKNEKDHLRHDPLPEGREDLRRVTSAAGRGSLPAGLHSKVKAYIRCREKVIHRDPRLILQIILIFLMSLFDSHQREHANNLVVFIYPVKCRISSCDMQPVPGHSRGAIELLDIAPDIRKFYQAFQMLFYYSSVLFR